MSIKSRTFLDNLLGASAALRRRQCVVLLKIVKNVRNAIRSHVKARIDVISGCALAEQLDYR
jgi:hypothetical protein